MRLASILQKGPWVCLDGLLPSVLACLFTVDVPQAVRL